MNQNNKHEIYKLLLPTNLELKENFIKDEDYNNTTFKITINPETTNYWGEYINQADYAIKWTIIKSHIEKETPIFKGKALIKEGKVLYYDSRPCGTGPFKPTDFIDLEVKERARIICDNIEAIIENYNPEK